MFLTSLSTAGIYEPADHTSQDKQRPPPAPHVEHPAGGLYYKLFGAIHPTQFTLHGFAASGGDYSDSPSRPSRASAVKRDTARKYFFW